MPDPVTKVTWGNPVLLSVADARRLGVERWRIRHLETGRASLRVPVVVQPGQAEGVVALALGYGRSSGRVAAGVGVNAFPLMDSDPRPPICRPACGSPRRADHEDLARTQGHHTHGGPGHRALVHAWRSTPPEARASRDARWQSAHLYPDQQFPEHKWGMAIDLSACVGCSACVIACQSENNIPVVGPEQVAQGPGDALDPHRPLLRRGSRRTRRWSTSPCSASTATTRPARTSAR